MKKLLYIFFLLTSISYSQELKLEYDLSSLDRKDYSTELQTLDNELNQFREVRIKKIDSMVQKLREKLNRYQKVAKKTPAHINLERAEELQNGEKKISSLESRFLEEIKTHQHLLNTEFYEKLRKTEKGTIVVDKDSAIYIDEGGKSLIIRNSENIESQFEETIRYYLNNKSNIQNLEGIWSSQSTSSNYNFKVLILKENYYYNVYLYHQLYSWVRDIVGKKIARIDLGTSKSLLNITWYLSDLPKNVLGKYEDNFLEFNIEEKIIFYKTFPSNTSNNKESVGSEWIGNGSGLIISKNGLIITNHHVIDNSNQIEVEFVIDNEVKKFKADVIQSDKVNDLSIIQINDVEFKGIDELKYNFLNRTSDVGTKVYAYGYPLALTVMGKEIKITDGIISSKSGYDGNITTYQITAPIQPGNSGGPLFDDKGNFIGINSSGLNKELADNVGYTIKSNYVLNLLDVLPNQIEIPNYKKLENLPLTEQIKELSKYVVLIKIK